MAADSSNNYDKLKQWRQQVHQRDGRVCAWCGIADGTLDAHHILPQREYLGLQYDPSNGVVLCRTCHILVHNAVSPSSSTFPRQSYRTCDGRLIWAVLPLTQDRLDGIISRFRQQLLQRLTGNPPECLIARVLGKQKQRWECTNKACRRMTVNPLQEKG